MRRPALVAWLWVLASLAACSTPPSRFYTLNATPVPAAAPSNLSVAVGPVTVPAMVDLPEIVVTKGPNQVALDEFNRWAAPLQDNIARVVAENLVPLLGTSKVTLFQQSVGAPADYRAAIEVQSFGSAPGSAATLDAVWVVRRNQDGRTETGRTTLQEATDGPDYAALAAAHSRALATLSRDIAAGIRTLEQTPAEASPGR